MKLLVIAGALLFSTTTFAASDFLAEQNIRMESTRSRDVLDKTAADPKAVLLHYQPVLDSGSQIVRPVRVTGTAKNPVLQMSVKKCVGPYCQTIDLDAAFSVHTVRGDCDVNYQMVADLNRSTDMLRDLYDELNVQICYQGQADGRGSLNIRGSVHQGPKYAQGMIRDELFKMLRMQVAPVVKALQETFKEKERLK